MFRKWVQVWIGRIAVSSVLLFSALAPPSLWADSTPIVESPPETGAFSAVQRDDIGAITVIDFAGNYDRSFDNKGNVEPRAVVAREFYRNHADEYDFLVVFTTFEFNSGDALALHWGIQNQVQGIGLPQYDFSQAFGSNGKLQGYIDMAALSRYVTDPLNPEFETVLTVLGHEVLHQWSGRVHFDQGLGSDHSLVGRGGAHWSNLLDTDGSVLYGHDWRNNGDGSFTSNARQKFFSPLDLYLAGLYGADEVQPLTLINNAGINPDFTPSEGMLVHGPTISGSARTVTIEDIIAAEGPRIPAVDVAQKQFRFGFVLLAGADEPVNAAQLNAIDRVRRAFVERFAIWTGGRATANAFPQALPDEQIGAPDIVEGGDPRTGAANIEEAFAWLRAQQTAEGFWRDKETTTLRDTTVVADVLARFDSMFARKLDAVNWLASQSVNNSDYISRQVAALHRLGGDANDLRDALLASQNDNGSWGINSGFAGNPLDTALAVLALIDHGEVSSTVINDAVDYLVAHQNPDGGWSNTAGSPSRTSVATIVLQALHRTQQLNTVVTNAVSYLAGKQNPDGGFGDSPSTVHDTANVLNILTDINALADVRTDDAASYLLTRQGEAGDWSGSTYATALAATALQRFSFSNWLIDSFTITPQNPSDGDRVQVTIRVLNDTRLAADPTELSLYDGDPVAGGVAIASDVVVPALNPGQSSTISLLWDSLGQAGEHDLIAIVDPNGSQVETSESDNRVTVSVTVDNAPNGIDLAIAQQDIAVIPANPVTLPADLGFAATVRNVGLVDAPNVRVQLRAGSTTGPVLDEHVLNIPNRTTVATNFSYDLTTPGVQQFVIVADGDNQIAEARENNNAVSISVGTSNSLDLDISNSDIVADTTSTIIGEDINFTVTLRNRGTLPTPSFIARYSISDGNNTIEIASNSVQIDAGQSIVQNIVWRVDREGALTFTVQLDPDNLIPELSEANNVASFNFTGGQATGPNLAVSFGDFTFDPNPGLEGKPLLLSALVRNTGTETAENFSVAFHNGDPAQGGELLDQQAIAALAAGAEITVEFTWTSVPDALQKLLLVLVDPGNQVIEFSEQDNRAFNTLAVLSLPDLAISSGDISLSPSFPTAGQEVSVTAKVSNLGEQDVTNAILRIFDGDPDSGGVQIGADEVINVDANGSTEVSRSFVFTGNESLRSLFVLADADNAVDESNELNNVAQRSIAVQDGNFFVSQRFISPNGDGVQDVTQLFFRLDQAGDVEIVILNEDDELVRRFSGVDFNAVSEGEIAWDGTNEQGRIVVDGFYRLQLLGAGSSVIDEATVTVDNNRSPLVEALGTRFASFKNLSCQIGELSNLIISNDENTIVFESDNDPNSAISGGLHRMDIDGGNIQTLISGSAIQFFIYDDKLFLNDDASIIGFYGRVDGVDSFWLIDGDGGNLRELPIDGSNGLLGFNADASGVLYAREGVLYQRLLNGAPEEVISVLGDSLGTASFEEHKFSPDRNGIVIAFNEYESGEFGFGQALVYTNLETRQSQIVDFTQDFERWHYNWSSDSTRFAVIAEESQKISVYDSQGTLRSEVDSPFEVRTQFSLFGPALSSDGTEMAFVMYQGFEGYDPTSPFNGPYGEGGLFLMDTETANLQLIYEYPLLDPNTRMSELWVLEFGGSVRDFYTGLSPLTTGLFWMPGDRTLIYSAEISPTEKASDIISLDNGVEVRTLFESFENDIEKPALSPLERFIYFESMLQARDQNSICFDPSTYKNPDYWTFRSLLNLTADLRTVQSSTRGGVLLSGSAFDLNFASYQLEYAPVDTPNQWRPIQAAANQGVIDDEFTTWIPPAPGAYLVRLTSADLAGNTRSVIRRISWSETQTITDLTRAPALFSPNGDGALDVSTIQYRVLAPVHLEFNFLNEQGDLVRTIVRDHTEIDSTFAVDWDGRDNNGVFVPDGRYRMMVQNYEFFFQIDTTAPVTQFALQDAYQSNEFGNVVVNPLISWQVSEVNYSDSVIERAPFTSPLVWQTFIDPDPNKTGVDATSPVPANLEIADASNAVFRHIAVDAAENRTITELGPVAEQLIIHVFGAHQVFADELSRTFFGGLEPVPYAPMESGNGPGRAITVEGDTVRFAIAETVSRQWSQLQVQYRLASESDWITDDFDGLYDNATFPNEVSSVADLDHRFQVVWRLLNAVFGQDYLIRLRAVDIDNNEFVSNIIKAKFAANNLSFEGLRRHASTEHRILIDSVLEAPLTEDEFVLWGQTSGRPFATVRVYVRSDEDPRYALEQEIGFDENVDGIYAIRTDRLTSCKQYTAYAVGERDPYTDPDLGDIPAQMFTTPKRPFSTPCLSLRVEPKPVAAEACDVAAPEQVDISLEVRALDNSPLSLLTLSTDDINDVVFNVNQPVSGTTYTFSVDTTAMPEGYVPYIARLVNTNGEEQIMPVSVLVDRTPPNVAISFPVQDAQVCGVQRLINDSIYNIVTVDGLIEDANSFHYTVDKSNDFVFSETASTRVHDSRTLSSFAPGGLINPSNKDFHLSNVTGPIAELFNENGPKSMRLSVYDQGGFKQCTDRSFVFDGLVELSSVLAEVSLFSPNGDDVVDNAVLNYTIGEDLRLDMDVYATEPNAFGVQRVGPVLGNVHTQLQIAAGSGQVAWGGLDNNSEIMADGIYMLVLTFTDSCGNQLEREVVVEIDNTAPAIDIDFPTPSDPLPLIVEVQGSINDLHMQDWQVEIGADAGPATWLLLDQGDTNKAEEFLAAWNTFGLAGPYTIRVTANDTVGNTQVATVLVNIDIPLNLISYLEAVERLFSPNDDGRRDATSIRFGLEEQSIVTAGIYNESNNLLMQLLLDETLNSGPVVLSWDGRNSSGNLLADGEYTVRVSAALASNPLTRQEEQISVEIDNTAPEIAITRPANGVVRGNGSVMGTVADDNLSQFIIAITDAPNAPVWNVLATENKSRFDAPLAALQNLVEGGYALRIQATDLAETFVEQITPFEVDNTSPIVNLVSPVKDSYLSVSDNPVAVQCEFDEKNPALYRVRYGLLGSDPQSFTTLTSVSEFPLASSVIDWDVSVLADGRYTIQCGLEDLAGFVVTSQANVTVDNTAPTVSIDQPGNGNYVTGATSIVGTASDDNLHEYLIDLAPGSIATAQQFSTIGSGASAIQDAELFNWTVLPPDGVYTLRLTAFDKANSNSEFAVEVNVDTHAPAAPAGLVGEVEQDQNVRLSWNANTESDLAGYHVYRGETLLTTDAISVAEFVDENLAEGQVVYQIRALDLAGNISDVSVALTLTIDFTPPRVALNSPLDGARVSGLIEILGTAYSADDFTEYRLYVAPLNDLASRQFLRRSPLASQSEILADWETFLLTDGEQYRITLEADDTNDNTASTSVDVTVDNTPPAAPQGLIAITQGADVDLSWNENSESDVIGYLLFRNDRLANAIGTVVGDLEPFAIAATDYQDESLADGTYSYTLVAMDSASNLSEASAAVDVEIDQRAPQAAIVQPAEGSEFDTPIYLVAESQDGDIATVRFEFRAQDSSAWILITADNDAPFATAFDPAAAAIAFGDYEFRAVATDRNNLSDTSPAITTLVYRDITNPDPVSDLSGSVNGGDISLSWTASTAADFAEYRIVRVGDGDIDEFTTTDNGYTDLNLGDDVYLYRVSVVDTSGNESDSAEVSLLVYAPVLESVAAITVQSAITINGTGLVPATVMATIVSAAGSQDLPQVQTDSAAAFSLVDVPLELGNNQLTVRLVDALGNISRPAIVNIERAEQPSQPTGLNAVVNDFSVALDWDANSETNLEGYRLYRNEELVNNDLILGISYIDDLELGGEIHYTLTAVNTLGIESIPSESVTVTVGDSIAPDPVVLTGFKIGSNIVRLLWNASTATDFYAYDIYRDGEVVSTINAYNRLFYFDAGLSDGVYDYYVVVRDTSNNESEPSNILQFTIGGGGPSGTSVVPTLYQPTRPGVPINSESFTTDIVGTAAPGAIVDLRLNNNIVAQTAAVTQTEVAAPITTENCYQGSLSPNGRYMACDISFGDTIDLVLYDYELSTEQIIATVETEDEELLFRWFDDSKRLVFADYNYDTDNYFLQVYNLETGSTTQVTDSVDSSIFIGVPDPDGSRLAMVGTLDTGAEQMDGLILYDLETNSVKLVKDIDPYNIEYNAVEWSPSGRYLTFAEYEPVNFEITNLTLVDTIDDSQSIVDPSGTFDVISWSPDSEQFVYSSASDDQLYVYTIDSATSELLTDPAEDDFFYSPQWSPDGQFIAYYRDNEGQDYVLNLETGQELLLFDTNYSEGILQWTSSGYLSEAMSVGGLHGVYRINPAGRFAFDDVVLVAGSNTFVAETLGTQGLPLVSEGIVVNVNVADLAITPSDITVIPGALSVNSEARIAITVHNVGGLTAATSRLSVLVRNANNETVLTNDNVFVPSLFAGESATVGVDWLVGPQAGSYTISVVADTGNEISESDEQNNFASIVKPVAGEQGLALSILTDAERYGVNQSLNVNATLSNAGNVFGGRITITIEDVANNPVTELVNESINVLAFGAELLRDVQWNTAGVFAGEYQAVLRVFDSADQLLDRVADSFVIESSSQIDINVNSDQASYAANSVVNISGEVQYHSGNIVFDGGSAQLQILDSADQVVFESGDTVAGLLPGSSTAVHAQWNTGIQAPGQYRVQLTVSQNSVSVAQTESTFAIEASSDRLLGSLDIDNSQPDIGAVVSVDYSVSNAGNAAASQLPVTISLRDPATQNILLSESVLIDLAVASTVTGNVDFMTSSLGLQNYQVLLQAEETDVNNEVSLLTLDSATVTPQDRFAPAVDIVQPAIDSYFNSTSDIRFAATDNYSTIIAAEYQVDDGPWLSAVIRDLSTGEFGNVGLLLSEGLHTVRARATDSAGNTGYSNMISFTVDNINPLIMVSGVNDGEFRNAEVIPQITVDEPNLSEALITLNGATFTSGTTISEEGAYALSIFALDFAGNSSQQTVQFEIDTTSPEVLIAGVTEGDIVNTEIIPDIAITDHNLADQSISLNGSPFISGTVISDEGQYELQVSASDLAGNTTAITLTFEIDLTAPTIAVSDVADGAVVNTDVTPVISIGDLNLSTTLITLNDQTFESGTTISEEGSYTLFVSATDLAGNVTEQNIGFEIDKTVPVIVIEGVIDGDLRNTAVTPQVTIIDSNPADETVTLNGEPFVPGTTISEEGLYEIVVTATDLAGNNASQVVSFEIDTTSPLLTISSPENGAVVTTPIIDIVGQTEPAALVTLLTPDNSQLSDLADGSGVATFDSVPLSLGNNLFILTVKDAAGNSSDAISLDVVRIQEQQVDLTGHIDNAPRVLVWLPSDKHLRPNLPPLAFETLLTDIFDANDTDYKLVHSEFEFSKALHSQRYNVALIADLDRKRPVGCRDGDDDHDDGGKHWRQSYSGHHKHRDDDDDGDDDNGCYSKYHQGSKRLHISRLLKEDLRPTIASGLGLIVVTTRPNSANIISDIMGAKVSGSAKLDQLELLDGPLGQASTESIVGRGVKLKPKAGVIVGLHQPSQQAALIINSYVAGNTVLAGFDPSDMDNQDSAGALLMNMLVFAAPADYELIPGGVAGIQWIASGIDNDLNAQLTQTSGPEINLLHVAQGEIVDPQTALWRRMIDSEESAFASIIRLPEQTGDYVLNADLSESIGGTLNLLQSAELVVPLSRDRVLLGETVLDAMGELDVRGKYSKLKLKYAKLLVKQALKVPLTSKHKVKAAMLKLYFAYKAIEYLHADTSAVRRLLGTLWRAYQLELYR